MKKKLNKSLCIFLNLGDSIENQINSGQWDRFLNEYIKRYAYCFQKVYLISYGQKHELNNLPKNLEILVNKYGLHRFVFTFLIPIIFAKQIAMCQVSRTMQATGGIPAIIAQWLFNVPAVINYGYDYSAFARLNINIIMGWITKIYTHLILLFANKIIVTTKLLQKSLSMFKEKTIYIPNGVNLQNFQIKQIIHYIVRSELLLLVD